MSDRLALAVTNPTTQQIALISKRRVVFLALAGLGEHTFDPPSAYSFIFQSMIQETLSRMNVAGAECRGLRL